ncbi:MAG: MMPL family transporter, partial [Verrucomicrobiota bacterium]
SLLTRLLVALLLVGSLGFVAVRTTKLNANLLSIFNPEQAEIRGRIIHQDHFLAQQDLLIGLETDDASATEQAVTSLAAHLRSQFPDLEEPSIKERPPWESNLAGSGELAAYLWAMSSASDLRRLSLRLSPGNVDAALKDAETTLAEALTPSARTQMVALDPLTLLQVPSLTTLADTRPPPELGEATLPGHLSLSSPDGLFRVIQMDLPEQRDFPAAVRVRVQEVTSAIEVWKTESSFAGTVTICGWATYTTEVQKQIRSEFLLSILTTAVGVFILIFGAYRRILPLFFLLITLALTLFITLILASGLLGELNRMSFAFAPILIALVVDYGVIVLQGISQGAKPKETRFPVIWAASTTALVFIGLNLSSVPGVAQFGTLVAMGIALGACLSLTVYRSFVTSIKPPPPLREWKLLAIQLPHAILLTLFLVCGLLTYLWFAHLPTFDLDPNNLGGRKTESARILEEVQAKLTPDETPEPDTILFLGASSSEVQSVLEAFSEDLSDTLPDAQFLSPLPFWPEGSSRLENQVYLREKILPTQERVLGSVGEVFEHETIDFLQHAYAYWERFSREEDPELVQPLA